MPGHESWTPPPTLALLDLDGTLLEAGSAITALVLALEQVGAEPLDEAALRASVGPPLGDSSAALPEMDEACGSVKGGWPDVWSC